MILSLELISFSIGVLCGVALTLYIGYVLYSRQIDERQKQLQKELDELMNQADDLLKEDNSQAEARLSKVREITEEQLDLGSQVGRPQKNALDGKYQNMISRQIKALEEQKQEILKSILDDGLDPTVGVQKEDGTIERVKLSEYMAKQDTPPAKPPTPSELKQERIKKLNLSLIRGGKSDGEGSGNTTH